MAILSEPLISKNDHTSDSDKPLSALNTTKQSGGEKTETAAISDFLRLKKSRAARFKTDINHNVISGKTTIYG